MVGLPESLRRTVVGVGDIGSTVIRASDAVVFDVLPRLPGICVGLHDRGVPKKSIPRTLYRLGIAYVEECSNIKEGIPLVAPTDFEKHDGWRVARILHKAGVPPRPGEADVFPATYMFTEAA